MASGTLERYCFKSCQEIRNVRSEDSLGVIYLDSTGVVLKLSFAFHQRYSGTLSQLTPENPFDVRDVQWTNFDGGTIVLLTEKY